MAEADARKGSLIRLLLGLAATVIVLAAVRAASAVVVPLLIALIVTVIVSPMQAWLVQRGWRAGTAFVVVALTVTVVLGALVWLTYATLSQFLSSLPTYGPALDRLSASLYDTADAAGFHLRTLAPPPQPDKLLPSIGIETRGILGDLTGGWLLVLAMTLFMLFEAPTFHLKLTRVVDAMQLERLESFGRQLASSMRVLTVTNLMVGIGNLLVLIALGVPNAVLWAALSFLLNYIPDVGFIISVIPPTVATLLHHGALAALAVLVAFIIINAVIDELVYPRMLGGRLDLAPFWTLVSLVFWGWLLGVAGAILAIPLTMLAKLVLDSFDDTRRFGTLVTTGRAIRTGTRDTEP